MCLSWKIILYVLRTGTWGILQHSVGGTSRVRRLDPEESPDKIFLSAKTKRRHRVTRRDGKIACRCIVSRLLINAKLCAARARGTYTRTWQSLPFSEINCQHENRCGSMRQMLFSDKATMPEASHGSTCILNSLFSLSPVFLVYFIHSTPRSLRKA